MLTVVPVKVALAPRLKAVLEFWVLLLVTVPSLSVTWVLLTVINPALARPLSA